MDIDIIATGVSRSRMDKTKTVFKIIKSLAGKFNEAAYDAIVEEAKLQAVKPEEIDEILQNLKRNGDVYSPKFGVYKPAEEK
jgi:replicative DNA helicase Mcm